MISSKVPFCFVILTQNIYIIICIYVILFNISDGAINVIHAPWFDKCTVWFMASLSCINMTEVMTPLVQYQSCKHLADYTVSDFKPDIALMARHNLYLYIYIYVCVCVCVCV